MPGIPDSSPVEQPAADHRSGPRKRGEALLDAIFGSVLVELERHGWAGFRMDRVAGRAHVSKASLYRRWASKSELAADAILARLPDASNLPDTGSLRDDLYAAFRLVGINLAGPAGAGLRGVLSDALGTPGAAARLRGISRGRGLSISREIVRRAGQRGELEADAITERQLEAGHAMLRYHFLTHDEIDDQYITELVDEVVVPLLRTAGRCR